MSQCTGLLGAARPIQIRKPISTELCIGRQPVEDGHPSVIIGCNPLQFLEALGTVDTETCSQNPQCVPTRDALTIISPISLPQMSGKISETAGKHKQDAQTFENDSILGAPKVAKRLPLSVSHNMYKFWLISENIELAGMQKILSRIYLDAVPICLRGCREFGIKMRVVAESQTLSLIIETAKVP